MYITTFLLRVVCLFDLTSVQCTLVRNSIKVDPGQTDLSDICFVSSGLFHILVLLFTIRYNIIEHECLCSPQSAFPCVYFVPVSSVSNTFG